MRTQNNVIQINAMQLRSMQLRSIVEMQLKQTIHTQLEMDVDYYREQSAFHLSTVSHQLLNLSLTKITVLPQQRNLQHSALLQ